jgi:hypothetical protein
MLHYFDRCGCNGPLDERTNKDTPFLLMSLFDDFPLTYLYVVSLMSKKFKSYFKMYFQRRGLILNLEPMSFENRKRCDMNNFI